MSYGAVMTIRAGGGAGVAGSVTGSPSMRTWPALMCCSNPLVGRPGGGESVAHGRRGGLARRSRSHSASERRAVPHVVSVRLSDVNARRRQHTRRAQPRNRMRRCQLAYQRSAPGDGIGESKEVRVQPDDGPRARSSGEARHGSRRRLGGAERARKRGTRALVVGKLDAVPGAAGKALRIVVCDEHIAALPAQQ